MAVTTPRARRCLATAAINSGRRASRDAGSMRRNVGPRRPVFDRTLLERDLDVHPLSIRCTLVIVGVSALTIVVVAAPISPAAAQDVTLQSAGGNGGDPYTVGCGSKAMVGVGRINTGWGLVLAIQPLC